MGGYNVSADNIGAFLESNFCASYFTMGILGQNNPSGLLEVLSKLAGNVEFSFSHIHFCHQNGPASDANGQIHGVAVIDAFVNGPNPSPHLSYCAQSGCWLLNYAKRLSACAHSGHRTVF